MIVIESKTKKKPNYSSLLPATGKGVPLTS